MRAIMIDAKLQRIVDVELAGPTDTELVADMRRIIGANMLGHSRLSDVGDSIWSDDTILSRGEPCFAFRLGRKGNTVVFGGVCIVVGADRYGNSRPPQIPIEMIENDCQWLGEIIPQVHWIEDSGVDVNGRAIVGFRAIVTYSRPQ